MSSNLDKVLQVPQVADPGALAHHDGSPHEPDIAAILGPPTQEVLAIDLRVPLGDEVDPLRQRPPSGIPVAAYLNETK